MNRHAVLAVMFIALLPFVHAEEGTSPAVEGIIALLFLGTLLLSALMVRRFGTSVYGAPFIHILTGIILLGLIQLLFALAGGLDESTLMLWWHLLFYLAMSSFLAALNRIRSTERGIPEGFGTRDWLLMGTLLVAATVLLLLARAANPWVESWLPDSLADRSGLFHFLAFTFAGVLASRMLWMRLHRDHTGAPVEAFAMGFAGALILLAFIHLWELLTESWKVIMVSNEVIEAAERVIWVGVFLALLVGLARVTVLLSRILDKQE